MSDKLQTIQCPVCFGVDEEEPCEACGGRGYLLRVNPDFEPTKIDGESTEKEDGLQRGYNSFPFEA